MRKNQEKLAAYSFGVAFIVAILFAAVFFPSPTPFQYTVFRIVLALAASGVAAMIPGFLGVTVATWIRAGGALGVFVIVFFFSPAQLITNDPTKFGIVRAKVHESLVGIQEAAPAEARRRLKVLEGYVAELDSFEAKQTALMELVGVVFHADASTSQRTRSIRTMVVDAIIALRGRDLADLFSNRELEGLDLVRMDFSSADLRGVSFRGCFLIETTFEGATLDGADFSDALIRNVNFTNASVRNTSFASADWFNATGFDVAQLQLAKKSTLLPSPKDEAAMQESLKSRYEFPFENWAPEIQEELRRNWSIYLAPNGLCETVSTWNPR